MARFSLLGKDELIAAIDAWGRDCADLRGPLTGLMLDVVTPMLKARFAAEGPGWAPLSESYAAWKHVAYPGAPILVRTGAMRGAFAGGVGSEFTVTTDRLSINPSRYPYWKYHQTGTDRMPARPILQFDGTQRQQMQDYVSKKLQGLATQRGFRVTP